MISALIGASGGIGQGDDSIFARRKVEGRCGLLRGVLSKEVGVFSG